MNNSERQSLQSWARKFGINLLPHQFDLLGIHLDELWDWNKKTNLTGLSSRQKIIKELFLDSLIPSTFLPIRGRLLDVGSGAGFPGIPLIICNPLLTAHLLEPNSKKASFLKQVIRLSKLHQVTVIRDRIENSTDHLHSEGYHIITARAVSRLPQVLDWCAPYLASEGLIINFQGSQFQKTLEDSSSVIKRYGLFLHKTISYTLPEKKSERNILIFKKLVTV